MVRDGNHGNTSTGSGKTGEAAGNAGMVPHFSDTGRKDRIFQLGTGYREMT